MTALVSLYRREPARINAAVVAVVLFLAARFGIQADHDTVAQVVAFLAPLVVGELTRPRVTPARRD